MPSEVVGPAFIEEREKVTDRKPRIQLFMGTGGHLPQRRQYRKSSFHLLKEDLRLSK